MVFVEGAMRKAYVVGLEGGEVRGAVPICRGWIDRGEFIGTVSTHEEYKDKRG